MSDELSEVWSLYAEDGEHSLNEVEACLLVLRDGAANTDAVARLFRALHTYKGNARILGLVAIETVAHLAEDVVGLVRDEGVALDGTTIDLLLETSDTLRHMLELSVASRQDVDAAFAHDLTRRLKAQHEACRAAKASAQVPEPAVHQEASPPAQALADMPTATPSEMDVDAAPLQSIVFEPLDSEALANDPVYREIFDGMARDALGQMRAALEGEREDAGLREQFAEVCEGLRHAAEQIGMREWLQVLLDFQGQAQPGRAQCEALFARLQALGEQEVPTQQHSVALAAPVSDDPVRQFLDAMVPLLDRLAQVGRQSLQDPQMPMQALAQPADEVRALAQAHGFARLMAVPDRVLAAAQVQEAPLRRHVLRLEFLLYEELASIADVLLQDSTEPFCDPRTQWRSWCVAHAAESLLDMQEALGGLQHAQAASEPFARLSEWMRQLHQLCLSCQLEAAAQLSLSMADLLERIGCGAVAVDAVLLHSAQRFVRDMQTMVTAMEQGQAPDQIPLERLSQDAADAASADQGALASTQIESRLGLPSSFHKLLTPENVKTALEGLTQGHGFYIVRADFNGEDGLDARFMGWVTSGAVQVICNVTCFEGKQTLFDFLISSPLGELAFTEALTVLDPKGAGLRLQMVLSDRQGGGQGEAAQGQRQAVEVQQEALSVATTQQGLMSGDMLQSIGELVTGQSMARHVLTTLLESDLVRRVESDVANAQGHWPSAQAQVRRTLGHWQDQLEKLVQMESRNSHLLNRLQEDAIAVRIRPANMLLRPLQPFVEGLARKHERELVLTMEGAEVELDFSMLDVLKTALRAVLTFCVGQSIESPAQRQQAGKSPSASIALSLLKHDDRISITVKDDGMGILMERVVQQARLQGWHGAQPQAALVLREGYGAVANSDVAGVNLAAIASQLRRLGGEFGVSNLDSGGTHFSLSMPLAMVVLEGMIVRVGEVQYVVPIDAVQRIVRCEAQQWMQVSADHARPMLRLGANTLLPIGFLPGSGQGQAPGQPHRLRTASAPPAALEADDALRHLFVLVRKNGLRAALLVDELVGQQQVLVRPLQGYLCGIRGVMGCALLGSGEVGMVLDVAGVLSAEHRARDAVAAEL